MIWTYFIIFVLAATPFFEAAMIVPVAIIGGIPAIPVIIISFLGNLLTLVLLIIFIDTFRNWRRKKKGNKEKNESKNKRASNVWDKYGLPGLAFLGPFIIGSHLTALLAVSLGGTRSKTLALLTASIASWVILLGGAAHLGVDFFVTDKDEFGFLTKFLNQ